MPNKSKPTKKRISMRAVLFFALTLILSLSIVYIMILNRSGVEMLTMEKVILEKSIKINDVISKLLFKTQMLSSLVLQNNGEVTNFEQMAAVIVDDPAILNILIAPDGVVSDVYPRAENEAVLGLNFFAVGAGNKEAVLAAETGQLVLGGPFEAVQGGQVLVGRLPVYLEDPEVGKRFWGLVSVTLKYPQALDGAGLNELALQDFAYEMWRTNPDTDERQIISSSGHSYNNKTKYVEKQISIMNADWFLRILPVRAWYEFPETWLSILICVCISLLVAVVTQSNQDLRLLKDKMELLSNTDPLTGLKNRRHFLEYAEEQMSSLPKTNVGTFIIMLDLDRFKNINDTYGHMVGDVVLKEVAALVNRQLRSADIFARYGGEEFVILVTDIDKASVIRMAERIRQALENAVIETDGLTLTVTASFGVAPITASNNLDVSIALADRALYAAKNSGRNNVVFYETQ